MEQKTEFEVIIVGAGPSGLAAALTLLEEGISDIIVMERFAFPRYKCCAGYITGKTKAVYETFGLNIEEAHYSLIKEFNIFYRLKKRQTIANQFLYTNRMIDRVELDNAFAELAKSKGIRIKENTTISEHDTDKKELKLSNGERLSKDYFCRWNERIRKPSAARSQKEYCHAACFPTRCARRDSDSFRYDKARVRVGQLLWWFYQCRTDGCF